jgi:ferredoxin
VPFQLSGPNDVQKSAATKERAFWKDLLEQAGTRIGGFKFLTAEVELHLMPAEPQVVKAPGMVPDELKQEPRSKGILTARKKKPKELAVITECCTGCAGSPACVEYCPVEDCMFWVPDEDNPPFGRIQIDPIQCIGCKKCLSKGPDGCFLDGCPWDAIVMVDIAVVEKEVGPMSY